MSSKQGTGSTGGGGAALGPSLQGSVVIDEARRVTGSLERAGKEPGTPLMIRGSVLDESLRFEAASLTERALVLAERSGAERSGEQPKRFIGSLSWATVDGTATSQSSVEITHAAPSAPSKAEREPGSP